MIQDFSNTFNGRQSVMVRPVAISGNQTLKKAVGVILLCAAISALISSVAFAFLLRSGLNNLDTEQSLKVNMLKTEQQLYSRRQRLVSKHYVSKTAGRLGLHTPLKSQIKHF
ncbi:hypothetical protein MNBD_DELTA03-884 [hydrothermal vent metagenome]|uniref:Cell division protein FtsL n=1 Tax=hydrothermal vent metagenome TaxID=652676 RepID=A0A3B0VKW4_9ZZZZ